MRRHAKALVAVTAMFVLLGASAALALQTHEHTGDIEGSSTPNNSFWGIAGLAVDQSGGDLYAVEQLAPEEYASGAIHRFKSNGSYDATFGVEKSLNFPQDVAVDNSGTASDGNVYVADTSNNRVDALDSSGALIASFGDSEPASDGRLAGLKTPAGSFASPSGLAVDQSNGNLFVADTGHNKIWIFDSSGAYQGKIVDSTLNGPAGLAFDSSSATLYVRDANDGKVLRFNRQSASEYEFGGVFYPAEEGGATDVAVNSADDHVYVDLGGQVKEYDSGGSPLSSFGQGTLCCSAGVAVDSTSGKVYASDGGIIRTFGPLLTLPDASTGEASEVSGETATLEGTVDAAGGPEASCEFQYGTSTAYGQSAPCEPAGPYPGSEAVHADLSGLSPATTYHYRLHATSSETGPGAEANGEDRFFTTNGPPLIGAFSVSDVETKGATLHAEITPSGSETTYRFEYVDRAGFEASGFAAAAKAPVPDEDIGSANTAQVHSEKIGGLSPETTYRFRVVATNSLQTKESSVKAFTTFALPEAANPGQYPGQGFLPDNRAWEMVSPADKNGGDVIPSAPRTRAAADGSAVSFASLQVFGDAIGSGIAAEYIAERSSNPEPGNSGWSTHAITPPGEPVPPGVSLLGLVEPRYQDEFSPDLDSGVFFAWSPLTNDPNVAEVPNLYLRRDLRSPGHGSYQLLTACPLCAEADPDVPLPPLPAESFRTPSLVPRLAGATPDFGHMIFESRFNLTADAPAQPGGLFGCVPGGLLYPFPCRARLYETDGNSVRLAGRIPTPPAIACDDAEGPACEAADLSVAGQGAGAGGIDHLTVRTISDGSDGHVRVFFMRPTENGTTPANTDIGNLYMRLDGSSSVQLNASERTDCAEDPTCGGDGIPDPVSQPFAPAKFLDASADGKRSFFLSDQKLTDDTPGSSFKNLYMYDATKPASDPHNLTFLATEQEGMIGASADGHYAYLLGLTDGGRLSLWHDGALTDIGPRPIGNNLSSRPDPTAFYNLKQSRVTPDGRHLLFAARDGSGLTGYDHGDPGGLGFRELYLYSPDSDSLQCVSCNPSGAPATVDASSALYTSNGGSQGSTHQSHPLSEDGRYVFFSTAERLVSRDINGVEDAYEFDSETGRVHLLSSGEDKNPSYFLDASADGSDAFFATSEPLSGWDVDKSRDIYDARIGGGFPEPAPAPPSCQGDACQPTPTQLNDPTPASSAFAGAGNQRTRKHHHRKHRRHHARKHHQRTANQTGRAGR